MATDRWHEGAIVTFPTAGFGRIALPIRGVDGETTNGSKFHSYPPLCEQDGPGHKITKSATSQQMH